MARTSGTTARVQRLIALGATALLAAATAAAFGRVFAGSDVTMKLLLAGLLSAGVAAALERRSLILATGVSALLMVMVVSLVVFPGTTWFGLPTLDTLSRIALSAGEVGEQAQVQVAPTAPLQPLLLAAMTAVWAAVFSAHALAFRAGSPLLALLPPVALVAFADTVLEGDVKPLYGLVFLAAGLAVAFADGLRRIQGWGPAWGSHGSEVRLYGDAGRGARRITVTALAVAFASPILIPGFGSSRLIDLSALNEDERIALSPLVSIAAELKRSRPYEVFRVTTPRPTYHRMMALTEFNGSTFLPPAEEASSFIGSDDPILPAEVVDGTPLEQTYRISHATRYPWLPVPYAPENVEVDRDLRLDRVSTTLWLDAFLDQGDTYITRSLLVVPAPEQLDQVAFTATARASDAAVRLPPDLSPQIGRIAERWMEGADSPYRAILAVQDHLRDPSRFTYSKEVPARGDSYTILDFLTKNRSGFCQQFASAMAVLLRTQGIPARVAVGFTQGTPVEGQTDMYRVSTQNYHAWVEVRFPLYGWLAFEPTPTRLNPVALPYLDPSAPCVPAPGVECGAPAEGPLGPGGTQSREATAGLSEIIRQRESYPGLLGGEGLPPPEPETSRVVWLAIAAGLLLVLLLAAPPVRAWRRRWRVRRAGPEPRAVILANYHLFTERAGDLGWRRAPADTPDEYRRKVESSGLLSDGDLGRLTSLTLAAAYGSTDLRDDDVTEMRSAAASALRDLRKGTPATKRLVGLYRRPD